MAIAQRKAHGDTVEDLMVHLGNVTATSVKAQHDGLLLDIREQRESLDATRFPTAARRAATPTDMTRKRPATTMGTVATQLQTSGAVPSAASTATPGATQTFRLAHMNDALGPGWMPPPSKEQVRATVSRESIRKFNTFTKGMGNEIDPGYGKLQGEILNHWVAARVVMPTRNFKYPKNPDLHYPKNSTGYKFHPQPERIKEPSDDMCGPMHREWLRQYQHDKDKAEYPVFHALERVDKALSIKESHDARRQIARDMLSRRQLNPPQFSAKVKETIKSVKQAVAVSHAFHGVANVKNSSLADEEAADKARIERAKSAPALRLRPPTPQGRVRHPKPFAETDGNGRHLRTSTPGFLQDEAREIKKKMRATFA